MTVGHLVARKRHADVLRALWVLAERRPDLRYVIIGDGPEREPLTALARELGLEDRVEFTGQLEHAAALERARRCHAFVMPSVDEAFGVAYIEAMAGWVPALGALGEPGPAEIARAGDGIRLVPPGRRRAARRDDRRAARRPRVPRRPGPAARGRPSRRRSRGRPAAEATVAAYEEVLRG